MSKDMMNDKAKNNTKSDNFLPEASLKNKEREESGGISMLARVSTLSWDLVVPIVGGVLLGTYIDERTGSELRWTLSLLVLGIIIAFGNLYNLYMDHSSQANKSQVERSDEEVIDDKEK